MEPTRPLPEGTVTFLFTDIEGSTRLLQHLGEGYAAVLAEHRRLLRVAFQLRGGYELDLQGDSFFVVFPTATGALEATVAAQRVLVAHAWPEGAPVRVRMGLHTGTPTLTLGEYVGLDVHRAARISSAGHGGQLLLSQSTCDLVTGSLPAGVSLRDLSLHRLKDLQQPEHLYQVVVAGLPADFPPLRSLEVVAHNLPVQLTRFIGREEEMAGVHQQLSEGRLVTLTGTGGCGKTRLALQVAAERVEEYVDGVWLVELAALTDPALVPQAVASTLGVREEPGRHLEATLADVLRPKQVLLMLDNCEHLVEACARLAEGLLQACPQLCILATSREALGILGEAAWRVPSLSVPEPQPALSSPGADWVATLTRHEAVRLFIERAQQSQPRFALTRTNAPAVAQVCQQLDGIPLAIELAAARTRVLSVEQIAARLDDRFRLLTAGSRTALPRQQTLRALVDWSYDLLSDTERILLRRLSVFAGGWTLDAAEAVCAEDDRRAQTTDRRQRTGSGEEGGRLSAVVGREDVLDLQSRLVDKSLVVVEERRDELRYRLLETIRQYCAEQMHGSEEVVTLRERHRDWYLGLAEQAEPALQGPGLEESLERLATEHDNLRAALGWSLERGEAEEGLRLGGALGRFWSLRGHMTEGRERLTALLSLVEASGRTAARSKALQAAGVLAYDQGEYGAARALCEQSLAIRRELVDPSGIARVLNTMGNIAYRQGEYGAARALFEESLAIRRQLGDLQGITDALNGLGIVAGDQADYAAARAFHEESLEIRRQLGDPQGIAYSLNNLGLVAWCQGDYGAARALYEESLLTLRKLDDKRAIAYLLNNLGNVAIQLADYGAGRSLHAESLEIKRELGDRWGVATSLDNLGSIAQYQGDYAGARALFEESLALRRELEDRHGIAGVLGNLGNMAHEQGDDAAARSLYEESLGLQRELGDRRGLGISLHSLGTVALSQNDAAAAGRLYGESLTIRRELGEKPEIAECLEGLAGVAAVSGEVRVSQLTRAARLFGAAAALRQAIGAQPPPAARGECERTIATVRARLGEEAFAAAWAEGQAIPLEQAIADALA